MNECPDKKKTMNAMKAQSEEKQGKEGTNLTSLQLLNAIKVAPKAQGMGLMIVKA